MPPKTVLFLAASVVLEAVVWVFRSQFWFVFVESGVKKTTNLPADLNMVLAWTHNFSETRYTGTHPSKKVFCFLRIALSFFAILGLFVANSGSFSLSKVSKQRQFHGGSEYAAPMSSRFPRKTVHRGEPLKNCRRIRRLWSLRSLDPDDRFQWKLQQS